MPFHTRRVAPLLFGSGFCALVYQVAWLREFRLVFGASTAASAAVLAIFIGGLGAGGLLLGPRADRQQRPLAFYGRLEALIALFTATTPGWLWLIRRAYIALGGSATLGLAGGTLLRLVLAALVLAVPTLLMGGTLPAAARAVETESDRHRSAVALLYGVNTLGAVCGSFFATFFLLELLGTRRTLWLACAVNLLIAQVALHLARSLSTPSSAAAPADEEAQAPRAPAAFVLTAASVVGFAFFAMELIWYRMLGPLLGGTVFTFGLILTLALLGIGLGGAVYSLLEKGRPATLAGFAWTCLLEAAFLAVPLALGDRIAVLALLLRPLGSVGFWGHVLAWSGVAAIVVLPTAFASGVQFPLLIALLGRGRERVGREIGLAYAWNTLGAIAGSLIAGFLLLPALSAPGCWRAMVGLLLALGLSALVLTARGAPLRPALLLPAGLAATVLALLGTTGPTAAWRHSGIGAGRAMLAPQTTPNGIRRWMHEERRELRWETDGVESSVGLSTRGAGLAFIINGKVDGHATADAPTQVVSGLLGTLLHGHARHAMVLGLGTGSTAGWLGVVPRIERVDVVELERGVLEMARACTAVNQSVLSNPNVRLLIGDGREFLLTAPARYDVVFSEPSNPYRAGIASLFTREYYQAVAERLESDGLFVQWVQAYEVDTHTVRRIFATLHSVFPVVETWHTDRRNVLLVASRRPILYPVPELRARMVEEPYRSALLHAWRVVDLEGFLARFVASSSLAGTIAEQENGLLNTDDRNYVEFGFAESVGRPGLFSMENLVDTARARGEDRPPVNGGTIDWARVEDERLYLDGGLSNRTDLLPDQKQRATAWRRYLAGDDAGALAAWRAQPGEPRGPLELVMLAETLAELGDESALRYAQALRELEPVEGDAVVARLRLRQGRLPESAEALTAALVRHRTDPWAAGRVVNRALDTARELARRDRTLAPRLFETLGQPFAALSMDAERRVALFDVSVEMPVPACVAGLASFEPNVAWNEATLQLRAQCYALAGDPRATRASADLSDFLRAEPLPFAWRLVPPAPR